MKPLIRSILTLAVACFYTHGLSAQTTAVDTGKQVAFIQWMWSLQPSDVFELGEKGPHFYRAFAIAEPVAVSETHGVEDRVYLLIGEFGERPDGKILDCGLWGTVSAITMNKAASEITITCIKNGKSLKHMLSLL